MANNNYFTNLEKYMVSYLHAKRMNDCYYLLTLKKDKVFILFDEMGKMWEKSFVERD